MVFSNESENCHEIPGNYHENPMFSAFSQLFGWHFDMARAVAGSLSRADPAAFLCGSLEGASPGTGGSWKTIF
jgi:hypothetical protein